jgi:type III pantothenate kinase
MNLIVDIGNSSTKLALYENDLLISSSRITDMKCSQLEEMLSGKKVNRAIVSSVREIPPQLLDLLTVDIGDIVVLKHTTKLPFKINYSTPATLGTDRIAAVAGAFKFFPSIDSLIIDAGTAITFDFLEKGEYNGGNISPGLSMRFRALNRFTGKLPLVNISVDYTNPGRNTTDAILSGVITGTIYEINQYIRTFENEHPEFRVIMTGGDSDYLKDKIDHQVLYLPDIVMDGLNYILEYNAK